jgi:hypothetical protein
MRRSAFDIHPASLLDRNLDVCHYLTAKYTEEIQSRNLYRKFDCPESAADEQRIASHENSPLQKERENKKQLTA